MKASWNWLTDYVMVKEPVAKVAERLTMAGLMVEDIEETPEDIVLDVEITSNRPDWLSHLGIVRELAALYGVRARIPEVKLPAADSGESESATLEVADADLCPLYTGRIIKGVKIGPSPQWLRERVESVGLRSVNNVVDATNFVMFECGQPLHAFDLAKIRGGKVIVRRASPSEEITLIDGSKHKLVESDLVIADAEGPVAMAGVMGGIDSEVGTDTVDLFLESAKFDQYSVRITSKRMGLSSDASYRFERGVDLSGVDWASRRCAEIILDVAGGTPDPEVLVAGSLSEKERTVTLRMSRMAKLLGLDVPIEDTRAILASLGFVLRGGSPDTTVVEVPSFRGDVKEEVDLIEEVSRIYGYDKVPVTTDLAIIAGNRTRRERITERVEDVLTKSGFYGCVSYSLVSGEPIRSISPWTDRPPVFIENRAGQENAFMRPSLVGSLLSARKTNEDHSVADPDLYEVAHIYLSSDGELPEQPLMVAAVSGAGFETLKGVVEETLSALGATDVVFAPSSRPLLEPGQGADMILGGTVIGFVGMLREDVRTTVDLREPVAVMELNLSVFEETPDKASTYAPLARFPGVDRDIAIVVAEEVTWQEIKDAVLTSGADHLESVTFQSIYRGKPIPEGKKSLAFGVVFRSPERTLTGEEADKSHGAIVEILAAKFDAKLR